MKSNSKSRSHSSDSNEIQVKSKKLNLQKNILDKYSKDNKMNYILVNLPDIIKNNKVMNRDQSKYSMLKSDPTMENYYQFSIKDIIPENTYSKIYNNLTNEKKNEG